MKVGTFSHKNTQGRFTYNISNLRAVQVNLSQRPEKAKRLNKQFYSGWYQTVDKAKNKRQRTFMMRYFDISISPVLVWSGVVCNDGNILSHSDHFATFHNTIRQTDYFEKTSDTLSHRQARQTVIVLSENYK